MAKLIALVVLFAIVAAVMAAPAEEPKKNEDLQTQSGIGLGFYGYPFLHGLHGYGLGYGYGLGHFGHFGHGIGHHGFHRGFYG